MENKNRTPCALGPNTFSPVDVKQTPQKEKPVGGHHGAACFSLAHHHALKAPGTVEGPDHRAQQQDNQRGSSSTTFFFFLPSTAHQILVNKKGSFSEGGSHGLLAISEGWTLSLASPPSTGPSKKTDTLPSLMTSLYLFPSAQWNLF